MKKTVVFDKSAYKDISKLSGAVRKEFAVLIQTLMNEGELMEPHAKKLPKDLYEMRVRKHKTLWRAIYSYINTNQTIILHVFQKNTQKIPINELNTAKNRYKYYI